MIICNKCNKENFIPGTRYCTSCGNKLNKLKKKIPENSITEYYKELPLIISSEAKNDNIFLGTDVNECPLFVSYSGNWLWYVKEGVNPIEIDELDNNSKNRALGFINNHEISPWIVVAWTKRVLIFNTFNDQYYIVWSSPSDEIESIRLPLVRKIGRIGKSGTFLRILLILKNSNTKKYIIQSFDFILEKQTNINMPFNWKIKNNKILKTLNVNNIHLILNPFVYMNKDNIFLIGKFSKKSGETFEGGVLFSFTDLCEIDKTKTIKISNILKNTGTFYQKNFNDQIIFWADKDDNPYLWSFLLKNEKIQHYMTERDKEKIYKTSPLGIVKCDNQICIALIDNEDKLFILSRHKIPQKAAQLTLDNSLLPVTSNNVLFAVDNSKNYLVKYYFADKSFDEIKIKNKEYEKESIICSNLVHANNRIYFIRDLTKKGKNYLRLEYL